ISGGVCDDKGRGFRQHYVALHRQRWPVMNGIDHHDERVGRTQMLSVDCPWVEIGDHRGEYVRTWNLADFRGPCDYSPGIDQRIGRSLQKRVGKAVDRFVRISGGVRYNQSG